MSSDCESRDQEPSKNVGIRWWPGVLVVLLTAIALIRAHSGETTDHQQLFLKTMVFSTLGGMGLLLWLLLLSRLPGKTRLKILAATVLVVGGFVGLFRIKGVSGNLVPILEFRWAGESTYEEVRGRAPAEVSPDDFPQFMGPSRDGVVDGRSLARDWQAQPPKELWRIDVGEAWSGFAVVGDAAVTLEQQGDIEVVSRYDLRTGEVVWTHGIPAKFETVIGGNGPRSTPTIHRGIVYAFGALGDLRALDLSSGELRWHRRLQDDLGAEAPDWGFTSSPLIVERLQQDSDLVVVSIGNPDGKSLVAFDAGSGESVWQGGDDRVGYSSPSLYTFDGEQQIVIFNGTTVAGHSPTDGRVLWDLEWQGDHPHVAQPVALPGDRLLVSSGYGHGSKLLQISRQGGSGDSPNGADPSTEDEGLGEQTEEASGEAGSQEAEDGESSDSELGRAEQSSEWSVEEVWESRGLKAKFANFLAFDGRIYGLDDGILVCLDPETGDRCWKRGRFGHGQMLLVGDLLLIQSEKGKLTLLEPNPEELRELSSLQVLDGKSWNTMALSGNRLLLRNAEQAVCLELPLAEG